MATVVTGKENIDVYRARVLLSGLKLEIAGMRRSRGQSCYAIIKADYGLKGSMQSVYEQFEKVIKG